jgi:Glucose / Sorbosone dehydrogenase
LKKHGKEVRIGSRSAEKLAQFGADAGLSPLTSLRRTADRFRVGFVNLRLGETAMTREVPRLTPLSPIVLLLLLSLSPPVSAATVRTGFAETQVASGLLTPTAMAFAPDGRLFVCQKGGQLRVIKDGVLLATPFVSLLIDSSGERGLLGVAFDPGLPPIISSTSITPRRRRRFTIA